MKKLILLVMVALFLTGCAKAQFATSNWATSTENGNKIYAYKDIDPNGEHTTIIVARVEGEDPDGKLVEIMNHIKGVLNHE